MEKNREWDWAAFLSSLCLRLPQAQHEQSSSCSVLCCARWEVSLLLLPGIPITSAVARWVLIYQFRMKVFPTPLLQHFPSISALLLGLLVFWGFQMKVIVFPCTPKRHLKNALFFRYGKAFLYPFFFLTIAPKIHFFSDLQKSIVLFGILAHAQLPIKYFFFSSLSKIYFPHWSS